LLQSVLFAIKRAPLPASAQSPSEAELKAMGARKVRARKIP
jgi:hypothetical protein